MTTYRKHNIDNEYCDIKNEIASINHDIITSIQEIGVCISNDLRITDIHKPLQKILELHELLGKYEILGNIED